MCSLRHFAALIGMQYISILAKFKCCIFSFTACVYQNMFLMAAFFCYPANPKSKLTKFKLQKNHNMTQQYSKCHQEVAKNMCITKSSNMQSSSTLKVTIYNHLKFALNSSTPRSDSQFSLPATT